MLNFGPSLIKPAQWPLQPRLTAAPDLWGHKGHFVVPFFRDDAPPVALMATGREAFADGQGGGWSPSPVGLSRTYNGSEYDYGAGAGFFDGADEVTLAVYFTQRSTDDADEGVFGNGLVSNWGGNVAQLVSGSVYGKNRIREPRFFLNTNGVNNNVIAENHSLPEGEPCTLVGTWSAHTNQSRLYVNGEYLDSSTVSTSAMAGGQPSFHIATYYDHDTRRIDAEFYLCVALRTAWSHEQVRRFARDPFAMLRPGPQAIPLLFGDAGVATGGPETITMQAVSMGWTPALIGLNAATRTPIDPTAFTRTLNPLSLNERLNAANAAFTRNTPALATNARTNTPLTATPHQLASTPINLNALLNLTSTQFTHSTTPITLNAGTAEPITTPAFTLATPTLAISEGSDVIVTLTAATLTLTPTSTSLNATNTLGPTTFTHTTHPLSLNALTNIAPTTASLSLDGTPLALNARTYLDDVTFKFFCYQVSIPGEVKLVPHKSIRLDIHIGF